jgi:hypothetical protein
VPTVHASDRSPARRRLERVGTALALTAMLLASGTQWVLLQSVAFASMVIRYSQDASLPEALARTFDGEHPCPLCHAVQEGRQEQEEQGTKLGLESRLDLGLASEAVCAPVWIVAGCEPSAPPLSRWLPRNDSPPKPRPRSG